MSKGDAIIIEYLTPVGTSSVKVTAEMNGSQVLYNTDRQWVTIEHLSKAGKVVSTTKVKADAVVAIVEAPAKPYST